MLDLMSRDTTVVEAALPAHMMFLMYEDMTRKGWEIRDDVLQSLNIACTVPFGDLDELSIARCAKRVDETAVRILHEMSPDDPRHGLLDCAAFVLLLANEFLIDPGSQPVLVALALMSELQQDDEHWSYTEKQAYTRAAGTLTRARLTGHYMQPRFALAAAK